MTSIKERFQFMDDGIDIPFYNGTPKLSTVDWLILLAAVLLIIGFITVIPIPSDLFPLAVFLTATLPALYICKGNYSLFFKKLRLKDIKTIVLYLIGIYIYTMIVGMILALTQGTAMHSGLSEATTAMSILAMFLQVFGEEFFKIFMLLLIMYAVYRFTNNRNLSLWVGLIAAMIIFGLVHYYAYEGRLLQILLIQGFGSIFEYCAYLKTKNVWVSFLIHILRDLIPEVFKIFNLLPTA